MICPNCKTEIRNEVVAAELGRKGGTKSKRKITPEQQAMMQSKKKERKEKP